MDIKKIAHITDLHCNGSDKWNNNFENLVSLLTQQNPDLIVVTGDSVHTPNKAHFNGIKKAFSYLRDEIVANCGKEPYIVTVPGNHDVKMKGIMFKSAKFDKNFSHLQLPMVNQYEHNTVTILDELGIALFPFDSCKTRSWNLAQGHIKDPHKTYQYYDLLYSGKDTYKSAIKIALLHHHPLPLPVNKLDSELESMMILKNAHQFLSASINYNVDLILHGHRHIGGVSDYSTPTGRRHPIVISSCGSSAHLRAKSREIKIYNVSDFGEIRCTRFTASDTNSMFTKDPNSQRFMGYGHVRKKRYLDNALYDPLYTLCDMDKCAVSRIKNKSKIVKITQDGGAVINISIDGITWKDKADDQDICISEYIRADTGRVSYGWRRLSQNVFNPIEYDEDAFWKPDVSIPGYTSTPTEPESFTLKVDNLDQIVDRSEAHCRILYHLFNGFMLTKEEHEECHGTSVPRREETCSIMSIYPTDLLELTIKFPSDKYFPTSRDHFKLDAINMTEQAFSKNMYVPNKDYTEDLHSAETRFLKEKFALRYWAELSQVGIVIRHPQPMCMYTLRWNLPTRTKDEIFDEWSDEIVAEKLREELLSTESSRTTKFYQTLVDDIGKMISVDDHNSDIDIWLWGYDKDAGQLKISGSPKGSHEVTYNAIACGRGVVGKSFRTRKAHFWLRQDKSKGDGGLVSQAPEVIVRKDYNFMAALGLPVAYPKIKPTYQAKPTIKYPIVCMVSIVFKSHKEIFEALSTKANSNNEQLLKMKNEALKGLYSAIWDSMENSFKTILPG